MYLDKLEKKIRYFFATLFIEIGNKTPILICSLGRGGSTLLSDIITIQSKRRLIFEPLHNKRVKIASNFQYPEFFDPKEISSKDQDLHKILFGMYRSYWTDTHNRYFLCKGRVIKMIRGNLLVPYIEKHHPSIKIVLLIRNPIEVIESWDRAKWNPINGKKFILEQSKFLCKYMPNGWYDFYKNEQCETLNKFHFWAINYYLPLKLSNSIHLIRFEDMLRNDKKNKVIDELFTYLDIEYSLEECLNSISQPSRTTRDDSILKIKDKRTLLSSKYSNKMKSIQSIMEFYELNKIYPNTCHTIS